MKWNIYSNFKEAILDEYTFCIVLFVSKAELCNKHNYFIKYCMKAANICTLCINCTIVHLYKIKLLAKLYRLNYQFRETNCSECYKMWGRSLCDHRPLGSYKEKVALQHPIMGQSWVHVNEFCFYKYHQEKPSDIKAARHLIIEQCMAGGRSDGGADSWLLQLRNNDAPKQTVGSQ